MRECIGLEGADGVAELLGFLLGLSKGFRLAGGRLLGIAGEFVSGAAGAVGDGLGVVGGNLGESFAANVAAAGSGIRDGAVIIGNGLGDAGGAIGDGLGAAVGGATNFVGDIMYNMTSRALYESGYLQAAAAIAIILVAIDLRKNKII